MKKLALIVLVALVVTVTTVNAGGDQVRGAKGAGAVNQHQVMAPPPFQP